jgi:uncharacterized membrane protein YhfC
MSAGAFAIAIVLVLLAFAVPALWYSTRRGGLQLADIGLVFVPTLVFVLTLVGGLIGRGLSYTPIHFSHLHCQ